MELTLAATVSPKEPHGTTQGHLESASPKPGSRDAAADPLWHSPLISPQEVGHTGRRVYSQTFCSSVFYVHHKSFTGLALL